MPDRSRRGPRASVTQPVGLNDQHRWRSLLDPPSPTAHLDGHAFGHVGDAPATSSRASSPRHPASPAACLAWVAAGCRFRHDVGGFLPLLARDGLASASAVVQGFLVIVAGRSSILLSCSASISISFRRLCSRATSIFAAASTWVFSLVASASLRPRPQRRRPGRAAAACWPIPLHPRGRTTGRDRFWTASGDSARQQPAPQGAQRGMLLHVRHQACRLGSRSAWQHRHCVMDDQVFLVQVVRFRRQRRAGPAGSP